MPKTRINCPNCRQPIAADIEQLIDVGVDASAKQRLLSGMINMAQCPHCGFRGNLSTPIVYHDPEKELLLTFFPPEVGLKRDDQERLIGALINQVINNLPQEKRKGYLLRPQSMLTFQGMIEQVLEADGITKEMIQAQQARLNLLQRLLSASPDVRLELARAEDRLIDGDFFALLSRLLEAAMATGDRKAAEALAEMQKTVLPETSFGRQMQAQTQEVEAALASLQEAGQQLTREKLLEIVIQAPNDTRLKALVSLARPAMDYDFFRLITERIERAPDDHRARLVQLRERLLEMTRQIDQQMEAHSAQARQLLQTIIDADDIRDAMSQNLPTIDDFFLRELNLAMETARKQGDLEKIGKLQEVVEVIQEAASTPPEIELIEKLLEASDESSRRELLEANRELITDEFLDALSNVMAQVQGSNEKELATRIKEIHRQALRFSMEMRLRS